MYPILSKLNLTSPEAQSNAEAYAEALAELKTKLDKVRQGGSERARKKHESRGKLFVREQT